MDLNDLLQKKGIDPKRVLVFRHRPHEPELNKVLPWLAAEKPKVFNAYQQAQRPKVEKAMSRASHVASFIAHPAGTALFVGLYTVRASQALTYEKYWRISENVELKRLGMTGFAGERPSVLWFDLAVTDFYRQWKGRLTVDWPPPERSWWRWADRNVIPVHAILEDSAFDATMPSWDEIVLNWDELGVLPPRWKSAIRQWRGIYCILDTSDGKVYVGSAYGADNLLGRWRDYAARGHGGNRWLRERDRRNFRLTILQRVSPDMPAEEVIRLEATWKERLRTRHPFGLNDN